MHTTGEPEGKRTPFRLARHKRPAVSDRDKCQRCEQPLLGGHDTVGRLETPFDSFHQWWHLNCYMAAERDRLMEAANVYNDRAVIRAFLRQEMKQPETRS